MNVATVVHRNTAWCLFISVSVHWAHGRPTPQLPPCQSSRQSAALCAGTQPSFAGAPATRRLQRTSRWNTAASTPARARASGGRSSLHVHAHLAGPHSERDVRQTRAKQMCTKVTLRTAPCRFMTTAHICYAKCNCIAFIHIMQMLLFGIRTFNFLFLSKSQSLYQHMKNTEKVLHLY